MHKKGHIGQTLFLNRIYNCLHFNLKNTFGTIAIYIGLPLLYFEDDVS